jgi:hypothetical protein
MTYPAEAQHGPGDSPTRHTASESRNGGGHRLLPRAGKLLGGGLPDA